MLFFAAVGIFLFTTKTVSDFGRTLMNNLTSLFGVVIGFYFASSAVVGYGGIRNAAVDKDANRRSSRGQPRGPEG